MAIIRNLIDGSSFEQGLFHWESEDVTIVTDPTNEGFAAALLKGGSANSFLIQSVPAAPGDTFELLLSLARDPLGSTPIVSASIGYYDEADNFLGNGLVENIRLPDAAVQVYQTVYGITSPAPPDTVRTQLTIVRLAATGTAAILLDQVVLNQIITDASDAVPNLFPEVPDQFTQSSTSTELSLDEINLLILEVTTTEPNQRVKLDAFVETAHSSAAQPGYGFGVTYALRRNNQTLIQLISEELFALVGVVGVPQIILNHTNFPRLTYIDVVPEPGTYTYTVAGRANANPGSQVFAQSRAINAIVYPPGA